MLSEADQPYCRPCVAIKYTTQWNTRKQIVNLIQQAYRSSKPRTAHGSRRGPDSEAVEDLKILDPPIYNPKPYEP